MLKHLEIRFIEQGNINNKGIIVDSLPKKLVRELAASGEVEIQKSIISALILSKEYRKRLIKEKRLKWKLNPVILTKRMGNNEQK